MKFKIRYADQIVGVFIVLSLVSLVLVIVLLGRSQRWLAKDVSYYTVLPSAGGLSKNMAIQYKGFVIGNVKSFHLKDDDDVEVIFIIHEEYCDRVKQGSLVEVMVSPIPAFGSQFLFHAGRGEPLAEGSLVPVVGSREARELIRQRLAVEPYHDDSITLLMNRASSVLEDLDRTLVQLNIAIGPGSDRSEIGKIIRSVGKTLAGAEDLPKTIDEILAELKPVLANIKDITDEVNNPSGLLYKVLDTNEAVYTNLVSSLGSISSILDNLDMTAASQFPQIAGLISELRVTIKSAEDVLVALTNNPLLRKGIPDKVETQSGGTGPRDIQF